MNKVIKVFIICSSLVTFACNDNQIASTAKTIKPKSAVKSQLINSASQLDVKLGEEFVIVLDADTSKGYKWALDSDLNQNFAKFISSRYEPENTETGAGPKFICTFKALNKGNTSITLNYLKLTDKLPKKIQAFDVNIKEPSKSKINLKFLTDLKKSIFG